MTTFEQSPAGSMLRAPIVREPNGPTRRRFMQGLLAVGGVAAGLPTFLAQAAAAATPIGTTDGVLVVVTLRGGNDALNTLVPISGSHRSRYEQLRQTLALAPETLLPVGEEHGLHPSLSRLAARFTAGQVAVVRGMGTFGDLSHFNTQATLMAGTAGTSRATGWLGRYGDGLTEWDGGLRAVAVGNAVPLHLVGTRVKVTALPAPGDLWGADTAATWERSAHECLRAFAASSTGLGTWGDRVAVVQRDALDRAGPVAPLYAPGLPAAGLGRDLTLAARLINADLGTRCVAAELQGWDTHAFQLPSHAAQLAQLDQAIETFFATLTPAFAQRVTMLVVSEFGRRPAANASQGTDHGAAGLAFVVGNNVRGGLYGAQPSLTTFDAAGNLVPTVDFRSLYNSVLTPWLAGTSSLLGGSYEDLQLFRAGPGATPSA